MTREVARKLIHVAAVAIPAFVWWAPRPLSLGLLAAGTAVALLLEAARRWHRWSRYQFLRRTRHLLRPHERHSVAGATWMIIAFFLAFLIFPARIAVVAMLYNGLGDAAAALVGGRWGRHRISSGKSWEGAGAALIVNLGVGLLVPGIPPVAAVLGAVAAAGLEFAPLPLDDNLRVTLGGGATLWLLALR